MNNLTLTNNDVQFLQSLMQLSKENREGEQKVAMTTNMGLLSDDLLSIFDLKRGESGAWCFNVYVEFEPMFKQRVAKEWQK